MAKYFKSIKSYDDLKNQYKKLLKANHPDNGGDVETMKEINVEYDALFIVWKNKKEVETGEEIKETADSTRTQFYTMFGWEGSNHDWNRSLKEVAQIVRTYVKEKYPTYKFSVRTSYASMCQELHVTLKESPVEIYKTFEELDNDDFREISKRLFMWDYNDENRINFLNASAEEKKKTIEESNSKYAHILNDVTKAVIEDVDAFVKSYNYEDCDGMIDYFDVDFYYFGCCQDNGAGIKIVPKTARIKNKKASVKTSSKKEEQPQPEQIEAKTNGISYKITQGEDTRDGSELWLVRINETLTREQYLAENKAMKDRGGYYSKFRHAFIFRIDPTEILKGEKTA